MTETRKMIYNANVTLVNLFGETYPLSMEVTGFNFSPSGNVLLRTATHKVVVFTEQIWKRIEFVLLDADVTVPTTKRLEVDSEHEGYFTDVLVVENTGVVQAINGEKNAPEYLKCYNPKFHYLFEITDEAKVKADAGDVSGELM